MTETKAKKIIVLHDPPPPYGGVRVSAQQTIHYLGTIDSEIDYTVCLYESNPLPILKSLIQFVNQIKHADGVLFLIGDIYQLTAKRGFALYLISRLMNKPVLFKGFAGGLEVTYKEKSSKYKWLLKRILSGCKLFTVQTKSDYLFFKDLLSNEKVNVEWLPNVRECDKPTDLKRDKATQFCFIGKVSYDKGAGLIIEAAKRLPSNIHIDLYGPFDKHEANQLGLDRLPNDGNVSYKGTVDSTKVQEVMSNYDALLLPTVWKTEGHPGVVLEAFSIGIPVIATRWNGIPELITKDAGILIDPSSVEELCNAMMYLHDNSIEWKEMRLGAFNRMSSFNPKDWAMKLNEWIKQSLSN